MLSGTSSGATFVVILTGTDSCEKKKRYTNLVANMSVFTDRVQMDDPFYYISKQLCIGMTPSSLRLPIGTSSNNGEIYDVIIDVT